MIALGILLTGLIEGLRRVVSAAAPVLAAPPRPVYRGVQDGWVLPPHAHLPPIPGPVWTLLWLRLNRLANRLTRLYDHWQEGTLPTPRTAIPRTAIPRPGSARQRPAPSQIPALPIAGTHLVDAPARLPRGRGWITRRIPQAGPSAGWLHELLQHAHTRDFVQAAPQAARLLRPLCHALGIDQPGWLKRPPRPPHPRKPRAPTPRAITPRAPTPRTLTPRTPGPLPLTDPSLKLQPYVIRAVRYVRKKYGRD